MREKAGSKAGQTVKAGQQFSAIAEIFDAIWDCTGWLYHLQLSEYLLCGA